MAPRRESDASVDIVSVNVESVGEAVSPTAELPAFLQEDVSSSVLEKKNTITWNLPFNGERSEPNNSPRPPDAGRRKSTLRRMSSAVGVVSSVLDPLQPVGNPLGIEINEIRKISSAGYQPRSKSFARPVSQAVNLLPTIPAEPAHTDSESSLPEKQIYRDGEDYAVLRLAKYDDIETMSALKRLLHRFSPVLVLLSIVAYWAYFALRMKFTLVAQKKAHTIYGMAWAFIIVEFGVAIPMMLHRFWCLHATGLRRRPKLRLIGDNVPSVDVVITCCKEDDGMVLNTALAACNIDYPLDRFRVVVCDDGPSTTLQRMIETAALSHENLYYRTRPKIPGVPHHFKAGNLNYAMEQTELLLGQGADFFAALDADMIAERDWLRALLPHMLQNSNCAMACPPQLFYNIPTDDPLCQSLDVFANISEPIKDSLGVAWCTGSGYVVRRKALMAVGGFPTGSLAEDVCCSSILLGVGAETAYVHEPLQYGTVPDSLDSHLKQRTRWTIGTIQTSAKLRFCLYGPLVRHMSLVQRICGFVYTVGGLFTIFLCISMVTAPIVLLSGGDMIPYTSTKQLRLLMRTCFFSLILNRLNEFIAYIPCGYHVGQRDLRAMMWMAPYHAIAVIQTFLLPKWLGGKVAVFTSSGSQKADLNERDRHHRAPLWRRLQYTLWRSRVWMHLIYIFLVIAAIVYSTYRSIHDPTTDPNRSRGKAERFLTHAGWPPLIWVACLVSCSIPIRYSIAPPSMPDNEGLLHRDPKSGVAYPTQWAREQKSSWMTWVHEAQYSAVTVYSAVVFAWSFYV